jgi:hypothetical protein
VGQCFFEAVPLTRRGTPRRNAEKEIGPKGGRRGFARNGSHYQAAPAPASRRPFCGRSSPRKRLPFGCHPKLNQGSGRFTKMCVFSARSPWNIVKMREGPRVETRLDGFNSRWRYQFKPCCDAVFAPSATCRRAVSHRSLTNQVIRSSKAIAVEADALHNGKATSAALNLGAVFDREAAHGRS